MAALVRIVNAVQCKEPGKWTVGEVFSDGTDPQPTQVSEGEGKNAHQTLEIQQQPYSAYHRCVRDTSLQQQDEKE